MSVTRWTHDDETYWRANFQTRSYHREGHDFDFYAPAYRLGTEAHPGDRSVRFEQIENSLERRWKQIERKDDTPWDAVRDAVKDAWNNVASKLSDDEETQEIRQAS